MRIKTKRWNDPIEPDDGHRLLVCRYRAELRAQGALVRELARRAQAGETITLLCSSACTDASRCHRTLLREAIERAASSERPPSGHGAN